MLATLGDDRQPATILRSVQRMGSGDARVSGEMRALLAYLERTRREHATLLGELRNRLDDLLSGRGVFLRNHVDATDAMIEQTKDQIARIERLPTMAGVACEHA